MKQKYEELQPAVRKVAIRAVSVLAEGLRLLAVIGATTRFI